jgi:hypothetical protein
MAAFADLSEFVNRTTGGNSGTPEALFQFKEARVNGAAAAAQIAGRTASLWRYEGSPSHGSAPGGTVAIPDNTTAGSLKQASAGGGRTKWLAGAAASANSAGTLILYDRLLHIGGFSGTAASAQTVGGTITRNTGGLGNEIWIEINTQIGATGTTITASYTDQDGNAGRTTPTMTFGSTGFREAERVMRFALATGNRGVRAVASVTPAATTGTAGDYGVVIARPLLSLSIGAAGTGAIRSFMDGSMIEIETGACLAWAWIANTTTVPTITASAFFVER